MNKLPILSSVREVFSGVAHHYFELLKAAWLWLLIGSAAIVGAGMVFAQIDMQKLLTEHHSFADMGITPAMIGQFAFVVFVYWAATVAAAIRWHRFVLLGEYAGEGGARGETFLHYVLQYMWTGLKIFLVYILLVIIVSMFFAMAYELNQAGSVFAVLAWFGGFAFMAAGLLFVLRISLALPSVALGQQGSLVKFATQTRGGGWRLLGYAVLIFLIIGIISGFIGLAIDLLISAMSGVSPTDKDGFAALPMSYQILSSVLQLPWTFFTMMVGVTMLSVAYREIIGLPTQNALQASD